MEIFFKCSRCNTSLDEDRVKSGYSGTEVVLDCLTCSKKIDELEAEVESLKGTITDLEEQIKELENNA
mgnify:CR=1 FL=1